MKAFYHLIKGLRDKFNGRRKRETRETLPASSLLEIKMLSLNEKTYEHFATISFFRVLIQKGRIIRLCIRCAQLQHYCYHLMKFIVLTLNKNDDCISHLSEKFSADFLCSRINITK